MRVAAKSIFASKTFWLNALAFGASLFGLIAEQEWVKENPQIVMYLGIGVSIFNVILRAVTNQPVKMIGLMLVGLLGFSCLAPVTTYAQTTNRDSVDIVEAKGDSFHRTVIKAALELNRKGDISRREVVRLRVAMLSPAFREHAQSLAIVQMSASGSENVPLDASGAVDEAAIDWDGLAAFMEKLIPLIIQLINAFSGMTASLDLPMFYTIEIDSGPALQLNA